MMDVHKRPRFCLFLGFLIAAVKGMSTGDDSNGRKKAMRESQFGVLDTDPRMVDAVARVEDKVPDNRGRKGWKTLIHDLTNLAIEWVRRWTPFATKFLAFQILASVMVNIILLGILIAMVV